MCAHCRVDRSELIIMNHSLTLSVLYVGIELLGKQKKSIKERREGGARKEGRLVGARKWIPSKVGAIMTDRLISSIFTALVFKK